MQAAYYQPQDLERLDFVAGLIPEGSRVLDCGARDDALARACAKVTGNSVSVIGIDISPQGGGVIAADIRHLPFKDGAFDVATALEILEHLANEELPRARLELSRVSRDIIVSVPFEEVPLGKGHKQYFDLQRVYDMYTFNRPTRSVHLIGKSLHYYGMQKWLARIDMRLLRWASRVWGIRRREGATWLVAKFSK